MFSRTPIALCLLLLSGCATPLGGMRPLLSPPQANVMTRCEDLPLLPEGNLLLADDAADDIRISTMYRECQARHDAAIKYIEEVVKRR